MQYSIVIPAHNEAANIEAFVADFLERLPALTRKQLHEVVKS